jgi:GAF domain-containing protein
MDGVTINEQLLDAIREFTGTILNPFDLDELLHRLTHHATAVVGAVGAGIMLTDQDGRLGFVAASEQLIIEAERHQDQVRQGACHEAHASNEVVVSDDLASESRWPDYTYRVLELGLQSVLGVPMNAHGQTIGVINVYRDHPSGWSADDIAAAEILAAMGAGYILNANQLRAQHALAEQLEAAIESRDVIGQAKGLLMAQTGVDADGAFELLRSMSQQQNRKLRDLAQTLVERRSSARSAS